MDKENMEEFEPQEDISIDDIEVLQLEMEEGGNLETQVVGTFMLDNQEYIGLVSSEDDMVLLYRYIEISKNPLEFELEQIEDDDEFDAVSDEFFSIFLEEE